jgi:hypothetical protein
VHVTIFLVIALYPVNVLGRDIIISDVCRQSDCRREEGNNSSSSSSSSYMALQPISGLGLLFMRFRNLTLIDGW